MEPLVHQPLQARFVEDVIGEFFIREHRQSGPFGSCNEFRGFFNGEVRVLADNRHYHADHDLQTAYLLRFLVPLIAWHIFQGPSLPAARAASRAQGY